MQVHKKLKLPYNLPDYKQINPSFIDKMCWHWVLGGSYENSVLKLIQVTTMVWVCSYNIEITIVLLFK